MLINSGPFEALRAAVQVRLNDSPEAAQFFDDAMLHFGGDIARVAPDLACAIASALRDVVDGWLTQEDTVPRTWAGYGNHVEALSELRALAAEYERTAC
ncbi:hypothetical protein GCM10027448_45100 [Nocardioides dilutus]